MSDVTLTEFLLARIAEDEAAANAALAAYDSPGGINAEWWTKDELAARDLDAEDIEHITRRSPDRVLADCEARRRIIERHRPEEFADAPGEFFCSRCQRTAEVWPCPDLLDLALPYADHPDYQEAWRV